MAMLVEMATRMAVRDEPLTQKALAEAMGRTQGYVSQLMGRIKQKWNDFKDIIYHGPNPQQPDAGSGLPVTMRWLAER